jgi:hypothetical protein
MHGCAVRVSIEVRDLKLGGILRLHSFSQDSEAGIHHDLLAAAAIRRNIWQRFSAIGKSGSASL